MTQKDKILNRLRDEKWHCTSEFYAMYMADPRTILSKFLAQNQVEKRWCQSHKHDGQMKEWRLKTEIHPVAQKFLERWAKPQLIKEQTLWK